MAGDQILKMNPESDALLPEFDPAVIVDLDVRPMIADGQPPLATIMTAVESLAAGRVLHLRSPFMPGPMIRKLEGLGFVHRTHSFADDDWSTWFWRPDEIVIAERSIGVPAPEGAHCQGDVMDLRLLPPPEPMLLILERIEEDCGAFDVLLPFYPAPLVPMLAEAGRTLTLLENRSDGVLVRIEAENGEQRTAN